MKADLHVHSCYSNDGISRPGKILDRCVRKGFGCVAITDHNSFSAYGEVKDDQRVIVIPAEEVSSSEGHILAYGIDREIPRGMGILETIEAIHEAGGIAIAAHPYRFWSGLGVKNVVPEFDGVEAMNSRSNWLDNRRSKKFAEKFGRIVTAGSDAHSTLYVGKGYVVVSDECRTWQDVIAEIKAGRAEVHSRSRYPHETIYYIFKSLFLWMFRGFRKV